ncbi:MAG: GspE/PulE family protein [Polyangiales bacterium]
MDASGTAPPSTITVTVGLLSGQTRGGRLITFHPRFRELTLLGADGGEDASREAIPAEGVAYVAVHRGPDEPVRQGDGPSLRVSLARGEVFRVRASLSEDDEPGFFATPDDSTSPFREFYFFRRGVRRVERADPLGVLLVERGAAKVADVARAVAVQVEGRHQPLGEILVAQGGAEARAVTAALTDPRRGRTRVGEALVDAGDATSAAVSEALETQKSLRGRRLGSIMVHLGMLEATELAQALAEKFHLPFVDLNEIELDATALTLLPRDFIEQHNVLPIAADERTLTLAIGDPLAIDVTDAAMHLCRRRVREVLAPVSQVTERIKELLKDGDPAVRAMDDLLHEIDTTIFQRQARIAANPLAQKEREGLVVRLANLILAEAFRRGASDIHVEPSSAEGSTMVRLRVDGDCEPFRELPALIGQQLVSRLKILADLDISEKRRPQDGKLRLSLPERVVEFRLATVPTVNGNEDAVLRVLSDSKPVPLDELRLSPRNLRELRALAARPYGLILCVGPTGSGKTTTLHALLGALNQPDVKVWTAEDPVEITQPGLRQVQMNPKIGLTFATALRTFLRADPDVIMVGEIRDEETASIVVEASLTGHLVLSTLHTNSAPETVSRLLDIGIDPFQFTDALLGVLAQRLARALCPTCKQPVAGSREEWERVATAYGVDEFTRLHPFTRDFTVWRAVGCDACRGTGYVGRVALHELLVCDDVVRERIIRRAPVAELRETAARAGMTTLLQDGLEKVLQGVTDYRSVVAVASR